MKPLQNPTREEKFQMSTGGKARFGMYTYVAAILVIGLIIAGAYTFVLKPGETREQPAVEAINPDG